jgi:hypothetical protein
MGNHQKISRSDQGVSKLSYIMFLMTFKIQFQSDSKCYPNSFFIKFLDTYLNIKKINQKFFSGFLLQKFPI